MCFICLFHPLFEIQVKSWGKDATQLNFHFHFFLIFLLSLLALHCCTFPPLLLILPAFRLWRPVRRARCFLSSLCFHPVSSCLSAKHISLPLPAVDNKYEGDGPVQRGDSEIYVCYRCTIIEIPHFPPFGNFKAFYVSLKRRFWLRVLTRIACKNT